MNLAVGVYHTGPGIITHPGGTHVMPAGVRIVGPRLIVPVAQIVQEFHPSKSGFAKFLSNNLKNRSDASLIKRRECPMKIYPRYSERIFFRSNRYPRIWIG